MSSSESSVMVAASGLSECSVNAVREGSDHRVARAKEREAFVCARRERAHGESRSKKESTAVSSLCSTILRSHCTAAVCVLPALHCTALQLLWRRLTLPSESPHLFPLFQPPLRSSPRLHWMCCCRLVAIRAVGCPAERNAGSTKPKAQPRTAGPHVTAGEPLGAAGRGMTSATEAL